MKLYVSACNGHRQVSTTIVLIDYTFLPLIGYTHNGMTHPKVTEKSMV